MHRVVRRIKRKKKKEHWLCPKSDPRVISVTRFNYQDHLMTQMFLVPLERAVCEQSFLDLFGGFMIMQQRSAGRGFRKPRIRTQPLMILCVRTDSRCVCTVHFKFTDNMWQICSVLMASWIQNDMQVVGCDINTLNIYSSYVRIQKNSKTMLFLHCICVEPFTERKKRKAFSVFLGDSA